MAESDLFFRIKAGQEILARHGLPGRNLFSFTLPRLPGRRRRLAVRGRRGGAVRARRLPGGRAREDGGAARGVRGGVRALPPPRRGAGRRRAGARRRGVRRPRTLRRAAARLLAAGRSSGSCSRSTRWSGDRASGGARVAAVLVRGRRAVGQPARRRLRRARLARLRRRRAPGWIAIAAARRRLALAALGDGGARCSPRRSASACSATCGCTWCCPRCTRSTSFARRAGCPTRRCSSTCAALVALAALRRRAGAVSGGP